MLTPFLQRLCNELSDRCPAQMMEDSRPRPLGQFCQLFYGPFTGNLLDMSDVKGLPVEVIDDVERPEGFRPERIA